MYRLSFTIDTPGFPEDSTNVRTAQRAYALQQAVWEAVGKLDGDVQHDDVEWVGGTDEGPWTFADEEVIVSLGFHIENPPTGVSLDSEEDIVNWLFNETDGEEQSARVYAEWRRREEGEAAAMAFEKMGEQYAGEGPAMPSIEIRMATREEREKFDIAGTDQAAIVWLDGEAVGWTDDYGTYRPIKELKNPHSKAIVEGLVQAAFDWYGVES